MRFLRHVRALPLIGVLALVSATSIHAQYEVKGGVFNELSQRPGSAPVGGSGTPTGDPTITAQYSNVVETSGSAGPVTNSSTLSARYPSSTSGIVLQRASIATSFASGVPRYFLGDRITPPVSYTDSAGTVHATAASFWRAQPIRAAEIVTNPSGAALTDTTGRAIPNTGGVIIPALAAGSYETFYYSPHALSVFACQPGQVQVTWRSSVPDSSNKYLIVQETFSVSSATTAPVRTFYWTEKSFNGPRVTIPSGRIVTVNPVFSNVFPATVATEFTPVGTTPPADPDAQPASELRTVWFEKTNGVGELHSYNISGRVLVEYLGALREDGSHEFLGADIVEVNQSADASTLTVLLGNEIRPAIDNHTLIALPLNASSTSVNYYASVARPDGTLAYYAEKENTLEDRVTFYWLEELDASIFPSTGLAPGLELDWPKYLHKYLQAWPTGVDDFAHYTTAHGGSSSDTGTGLKFEGGNIPALVYQDDEEQDEATIDALTQRLLVGITGDGLNRSLLKFTGDNGTVWYVRIMTQAEDRSGFLESDGAAPLTGVAYVGDRLNPPAGYTSAGYIAAGTAYSASAYKDPFASGMQLAQSGAIIPVNALPSNGSSLEVWWFKKYPAPSADFPDLYVPAKIGRYTLAWRNDNPKIVLASNEGTGDLSPPQIAGSLYIQNNPSQIGYNPNEEHALMLNGRAYALRDDLNVVTTSGFSSQPRVLIQYTDSTDNRPAMSAFEVVREDSTHTFSYPITAGTIINSPMPLPFLPLPVDSTTGLTKNTEVVPDQNTYPPDTTSSTAPSLYSSFTFKDRKGYDWVYRGPHGSASAPALPATASMSNYEFNTAGDFGKWTSNANLTSVTVANGAYSAAASATNGDAQIVTVGLTPFSGTSTPTVEVRMKASVSGTAQLFWANEEGGFSGTNTASAAYSGSGDWQIVTFTLSSSVHWNGKTISSLRFDPVSVAGATFQIDYIRASAATPALGMQWYYTMRDGFYFPTLGGAQPAEGTILPYLRPKNSDGSFSGNVVSGTPITVAYLPTWPTDVPSMSVGETLSLPNHGLPAVRGQTSALVLYQQSIAQSGSAAASVTLHDPTRAKSVLLNDALVGLSKLPSSAAVTSQNGKTYFQLLPPHLQQRFYFDPNLGTVGGLVLVGQFVDEIAGEDYVHLNTLSSADITSLRAVVNSLDSDYQKWVNAINNLTTRVETFIEDPAKKGTYIADSTKTVTVGATSLAAISSSDTAVDSYALTATGAGSGYATLIFGNGYAFTPVGEPVSISIVKIAPQLYTGDLKTLPASNPLDEQTTLRHSGDFAALPDNYEFEWRYAAPQDGVAPSTYTYSMATAMGSSNTTHNWLLARNLTTPLPSTYPTTQYEFARTTPVNDASHNAASIYPGMVAKSVNPLTLTATVPSQIVFSVELGTRDGFVLYVNGTAALASRLPTGIATPAGLTSSDPRSDLSTLGLTYQYTVPSSFFNVGDNRIEVAYYSSASANSNSSLNIRIDTSVENDQVANSSIWIHPNGTLSNTVIVGGSADSPLGNPLIVFSDMYFTVRYRAKTGVTNVAGTGWSRWMTPKLVESWIKRALDGINPFTQRTDDLFNNPVSTDVSILTQAGKRWEGDVALTLDTINGFGLIEIYETLLNRAKNLSIDAGYNDASTNDTLLLVAGYLNDLYIVLGNEASDDADNPTIAIDGDTGQVSTARFSFEGQVPNLISEELGLLRGRDDFLSPGVTAAPSYNRLYWNYINGVDSGESIYAINYDIKEKAGASTANGTLDAADAQYMFPQGHGDAYGHYLTALTGYYKLLTSPYFTWTPRSESVDVLGQTVQVDYQDERKFAAAASNVARVAARVLDVTARSSYRDDPSVGWAHQRDGKVNSNTGITRRFGSDEWAARAGMGAYFHWVSANAMLPDKDTNPQHNGIQIIDRTTVPELSEIVSSAIEIQASLDALCAHLNPLGLAKGAIAFDISPTELKAGKSHFEQIYERALRACLNAKAAFDQANVMNRLLRNQNNSLDEYNNAVDDQEKAYEYDLLTLLGSAYPGDVGPGKLYEQGYTGPDLYHYYMIDQPSSLVDTTAEITVSFREPIEMNPFTEWSIDNVYNKLNDPLQYTTRTQKISPNRLMQFPAANAGTRAQPGAIQAALADAYIAQINARESANTLDTLMRQFNRDYQLFTEFRTEYDDANDGAAEKLDQAAANLKAITTYSSSAALLDLTGGFINDIAEATAESFPTVAGFAIDATSVARGLSVYGGATQAYAQSLAAIALNTKAAYLQLEADQLSSDADDFYAGYDWTNEDKQHVIEFEKSLDTIRATGFELSRRLAELQKSNEEVSRLVARSNQILAKREVFRQRAAAVIQGYRTRDMTYRTFRNEELSQYQSLYDLAAQYTYLAVQSYDYETGLLGTTAGQSLIDGIVSTRSLGEFQNGLPVATTGTTGDGGLASLLARLQADWSVVESRLGINNPDTNGTVFSLRQELFRVRTDAATTEDDKAWKQVLEQHIMSNVLNDPDVAQYANNIRKADGSAVPGIVIPFSTTVGHGLNFFGLPIAGGDHAYTASNYATKIAASGIIFKGYVGMDPYSIGTPNAGGPASSNANALSATPYAYLIPAGVDSMLAPSLGDTATVRSWTVKDQAIPLPFNLGQSMFSASQFFTPSGTVNEKLWITRKHPAFRAVNDPAFFYSTVPGEFTNSRLIGRSVWNSQWKIVIPAYTLLNNQQDGMDRFVRSVTDIQLFLRTYSHSGN